jgi:hypothetical protein
VEVKGHGDMYSKFLIFLESIQESRAEQSAVQEDPDRKTATAEIDMFFFFVFVFFRFPVFGTAVLCIYEEYSKCNRSLRPGS